MVVSNIIQHRKKVDVNSLVQKLNSITLSNDVMNNLFPSIVNAIPEKRKRGRPRQIV